MALGTTLKVGFDATSVQTGFAKMKAGAAGVAGGIAKLGASLAAIGAAGAAGLVALAVKINSIGEAGISGDKALQNVVKQMGLFGSETNNVTKRLIDYADITSRQTGLDGAAIGATQTKLLTFKELAKSAGVVGGAFDRATMAALDMASAGFGTAETNAVQLGKALNDPIKGINSLTRSGITFTTEEKKKIATMVESGDILKAQNVILKAIETQVGGTANATATASGKIKASFVQIVDAFAEPFSQGFTNLPAALEKQFEGLIEMATQAGDFIGTAIRESIQGNHDKFVLIGEIIGEGIKLGLKNALEKTGISAIEGISKMGEKGARMLGVDSLVDAIAGKGSFDKASKASSEGFDQSRDAISGGNYNTSQFKARVGDLGRANNQVQIDKLTAERNAAAKASAEAAQTRINQIQADPFSVVNPDAEIKTLLKTIATNTKSGAKM